ncbi:MAG: glutathione peroxidase [Flavobacteriales bacterium]|nr:glutathione peroxidase [Flavobacteriales bacterium]
MKNLVVILAMLSFSLISCGQNKPTLTVNNEKKMDKPSIHQFKVTDINGNVFDFSKYKGYKILVVNTASECGLTPQYAELQQLYERYKDKNVIIVAFPANNFGAQEPGTNKEIATFCQKNYGVTFPVMSKVSVKGADMCDVYQFLTQKDKNLTLSSNVEWNFQKYLLNEKGELVQMFSPQTKPMSPEIMAALQQ